MFYGWIILAAICAIYFLSLGTVFYGFRAFFDLTESEGIPKSVFI